MQVGTTDSEAYTPIVLDRIRSVHRRRSRRPMKIHSTYENRHQWRTSSLETFCVRKPRLKSGLYQHKSVIETAARCLDGGWPEKDPSRTNVLRPLFASWEKDARSDIRRTAWRTTLDPEGGLGVPLNHPRFLEWLGAPDSAWLLEMSPGHWCDTLSRVQAMTAAMQLHRDACLMQTNLDILDQYALALHGTASKLLQRTMEAVHTREQK